jgi:hypothetical protein
LHNNKCELICWFILQEINEELKRRVEAAAKIISNGGTDETNSERLNSSFNKNNSMSGLRHEQRGGQSPLQAFITNLVIFVSVVLFGLVVQYVVTRSGE